MNGDLLLRLTLTKTKNIAIGILLLFTLAIDDNCVRQDLQETSSSTETSFPPIEKCINWPTNRLKNHQFYELDNKNTVPQIEEKTITQNRRYGIISYNRQNNQYKKPFRLKKTLP